MSGRLRAQIQVSNCSLNALLFFNFPALGVCYSADKNFHLKFFDQRAFLIISMLIWASFIGWVFWKIAATFLGEEELEFETHPEKAKFDWERFRIRFFFGFIIGFLCGWRFVKKTHSMQTVVVASIVAGIIGGFVFGISRPPNFWSRP